MQKETFVGLTMLAGLFTTLGVVVFHRVVQDDNSPLVGSSSWSKPDGSVLHGAPAGHTEDSPASEQLAQRSTVRPAANYVSVAETSETAVGDPLANSGRSSYQADPLGGSEPAEISSEAAQPLDPPTEDRAEFSSNHGRESAVAEVAIPPAPPVRMRGVERSVLRHENEALQQNPIRRASGEAYEGETPAQYETNGARLAPNRFQADNESPATTWRHDANSEPATRPVEHQQSLRDSWDEPTSRGRQSAAERFEDRTHANTRAELPPGNQYKIQPNDTYWSISEKSYGNAGYYKALHAYNKKLRPAINQLDVGQTVSVPDAGELERQYPDLCPKRRPTGNQTAGGSLGHTRGGHVYVVEKGDTLFDIARQELGKASRWAEIYDLNKNALGEDFDYLRPGLELALPEGDATAGRSGFSRNR
jgi:nucleoid-associated protein YgaU